MFDRSEYNQKKKELIAKHNKEYYALHKERLLKYGKEYYAKNKDAILKKNNEYYRKNLNDIKTKRKQNYETNREHYLSKKKLYHEVTYPKIKKEVLTYYGNGKLECVCCGENIIQFLTIDHINNDGYAHRKIIGGKKIYLWLKSNNYPIGFQTLCSNCNSGKNINKGICPHRLLKNTLPIKVMWSN